MKVKELIDELNKIKNRDAEVYIESKNMDHFEVDGVLDYDPNSVFLEAILTNW